MTDLATPPRQWCPCLAVKRAREAIDFNGHAFGAVGPERIGGSPMKLCLDVADADAFVTRAVTLEFHGHRTALLTDPFGYGWFIASRLEVVSPLEMQRRWQAVMAAPGGTA